MFKNKRKENTFFLPSPPSDVDTVVVELKLSREVIMQRLFSCALEARRHPDVSKGVYSFVLTFKKKQKNITSIQRVYSWRRQVEEIRPVTTAETKHKTANKPHVKLFIYFRMWLPESRLVHSHCSLVGNSVTWPARKHGNRNFQGK